MIRLNFIDIRPQGGGEGTQAKTVDGYVRAVSVPFHDLKFFWRDGKSQFSLCKDLVFTKSPNLRVCKGKTFSLKLPKTSKRKFSLRVWPTTPGSDIPIIYHLITLEPPLPHPGRQTDVVKTTYINGNSTHKMVFRHWQCQLKVTGVRWM